MTLGALVLTIGAPAAGRAQSVDQTCALALTKADPATLNIAYPDDSAQYYVGAYQLVPGTRVRIAGAFPHARYMSFNAYDPAQRPIAGITDTRIVPDPGSANPFAAGADRTTRDHRSYTVFLDPGARPGTPAPNTLYTGTGQDDSPNVTGTFIYRIYIPDRGTDDTGGVGLPTVVVEPSTATAPPASPSPCAGVAKPTVAGINEALAASSPPSDPPQQGGTNPPTWRKFVNLASSIAINATGTPSPGGADLDTLGGSGGFLSNLDNAYVSTPTTRTHGKVLVTRFRAPTFPDTRAGAARMPGGQLRYWSMCQNDPPTQRFIACINDDRAVIGGDGFVTFVVSTPGARPVTATRACGVNWMPWGPNAKGLLLYRNMLPEPAFAQSIQAAKVDHEGETMGDFLPASTYYADAGAYATALPCTPPRGATARPARPRTCRSKRTVTVTLPRSVAGVRHASVRIGRRKAHRVKVRGGRRLTVDLRGLPKGTYRVRIRARGRLVTVRTYHTCRPGP